MDGRSNVGIKKAEKVLCMVLAMLMAIVITINVSAGESISKAKIDEYLYTIAYSQQEHATTLSGTNPASLPHAREASRTRK